MGLLSMSGQKSVLLLFLSPLRVHNDAIQRLLGGLYVGQQKEGLEEGSISPDIVGYLWQRGQGRIGHLLYTPQLRK